jgi:hypothetical protein
MLDTFMDAMDDDFLDIGLYGEQERVKTSECFFMLAQGLSVPVK